MNGSQDALINRLVTILSEQMDYYRVLIGQQQEQINLLERRERNLLENHMNELRVWLYGDYEPPIAREKPATVEATPSEGCSNEGCTGQRHPRSGEVWERKFTDGSSRTPSATKSAEVITVAVEYKGVYGDTVTFRKADGSRATWLVDTFLDSYQLAPPESQPQLGSKKGPKEKWRPKEGEIWIPKIVGWGPPENSLTGLSGHIRIIGVSQSDNVYCEDRYGNVTNVFLSDFLSGYGFYEAYGEFKAVGKKEQSC